MTIVQLIRMARHQFVVRQAGGYKTWINTELDARWVGARGCWDISGNPAFAQVIQSSWVATCSDCPESVIVDIDEPFYCPNCQNVKNQGLARPVIFPENREAIEQVLLLRADPNTRNWKPGETIEMLKQENIEHGESIDACI